MPNIQVLDPHVADLIAAGEVVERPASVAKELMENAIDAGASSVTVEIAHGGLTFLRVTDDGKGIPSDQLRTAFLRHATSKLRTEYDLEAIGTLGFRGPPWPWRGASPARWRRRAAPWGPRWWCVTCFTIPPPG